MIQSDESEKLSKVWFAREKSAHRMQKMLSRAIERKKEKAANSMPRLNE